MGRNRKSKRMRVERGIEFSWVMGQWETRLEGKGGAVCGGARPICVYESCEAFE